MDVKPLSTATGLTRAQKQARTRAALLDAGARVFVTHGFQGASVELIASEAGYTRGAFYSGAEARERIDHPLGVIRADQGMADE